MQAVDSSRIGPRTCFAYFIALRSSESARILTERKYDTSDSSSETSSDSDALDFDLEVEESWRARLANFITEIHAYANDLLVQWFTIRTYFYYINIVHLHAAVWNTFIMSAAKLCHDGFVCTELFVY